MNQAAPAPPRNAPEIPSLENNVAGIILHISALAAVVVLWLVWKNKRVVHLLPSEPDKRLGAPHGASQSRPVNYCMQDSRGPNSIGRRQMRQHMRDVS